MKKLQLLFLITFYSLYVFADTKITKILVENNNRIETKTVESYLGIKVGDIFSDKNKIESVKTIFNTSGASEATKNAIKDFTFKAFETLEKIDIKNEKRAILKAFGENLMGRNV